MRGGTARSNQQGSPREPSGAVPVGKKSPLRRRRGVHGQRCSLVGAADDWQRLQLPGPLTPAPRIAGFCGNRTLRLSLLPLCRQLPAPLGGNPSDSALPSHLPFQGRLSPGDAETSVPSELEASPSRGRRLYSTCRIKWTHRRFNWMHKPGTAAGSLKKTK